MKIKLLVAICFLMAGLNLKAQVTIGDGRSPHKDAVLDLESGLTATNATSIRKGLLLPRVELQSTTNYAPLSEHTNGMLVFNLATAGTGSSAVTPGIYYNDGSKWVRVNSPFLNWFYMPSTPINTEKLTPSSDPDLELNMYNVFTNQFKGIPATENSSGAVSSIMDLPDATDFDYFVTGYDKTVFDIKSVSKQGILKYRIIGAATDSTYLNIVFVLK